MIIEKTVEIEVDIEEFVNDCGTDLLDYLDNEDIKEYVGNDFLDEYDRDILLSYADAEDYDELVAEVEDLREKLKLAEEDNV
jgi:hypothetical protein